MTSARRVSERLVPRGGTISYGRTTRPGRRRAPSVVTRGCRRLGYVLLETVMATGLLVVGLAVLGAQVQDAQRSVWKMERRLRAMMLAEQQLALLDLGLVELDSVDEIEEGDFGERYPDFAWQLRTDRTMIEDMYLLRVDIFHHLREGEYEEDDFDYENGEIVYTVYAMRAMPRPVNFGEDFGLNEEEMVDLSDKFSKLGIDGLDAEAFDPRWLAKPDFDELIEALPVILDAFGMDLSDLASMLPPELLQQIKDGGLLDEAAAGELFGDEGQEPTGEEGRRPTGGEEPR